MATLNRAIRLSLEATRELFGAPTHELAYQFLRKDGTFMYEKNAHTQHDEPHAACVATWAEALRFADEHSVDFIAMMHGHAVRHRMVTPYGHSVWFPTVVFPHDDFYQEWDQTTFSAVEPKLRRPRKTPNSGAARKRRRREKLQQQGAKR